MRLIDKNIVRFYSSRKVKIDDLPGMLTDRDLRFIQQHQHQIDFLAELYVQMRWASNAENREDVMAEIVRKVVQRFDSDKTLRYFCRTFRLGCSAAVRDFVKL